MERVVSEYHHLCSSIGLNCSLREFYRKKVYRNRQAQLLEGVPFSEMGFVGVTDLFEISLALFNEKYGTKLEYLEMNKGKYKVSKKPSTSQEEIEEIKKLKEKAIPLGDLPALFELIKEDEEIIKKENPKFLTDLELLIKTNN